MEAYPPSGENPAWGDPEQQAAPAAKSEQSNDFAPAQSPLPDGGKWQTGICDCCDDMESFCWACWCPCVQFGRNLEIIDEGHTSCLIGGGIFYLIHLHTLCGAMYSCGYRRKLRLKYALPEQPCDDYLTDCCCLPCSLSQQSRELQKHGVNVNLGTKQTKKHIFVLLSLQ